MIQPCTAPTANYQCNVSIAREEEGSVLARDATRLVRYLCSAVGFVAVSWAIGTVVQISANHCSPCLDWRSVFISVCTGAVVVLISIACLTCLCICCVSAVKLGTPSDV